MCNPQKEILYLSRLYHGRIHDYLIFKKEFPKNINWFIDKTVRVELGFLGIESDYKCRNIAIPEKNYKNRPLTDNQKYSNKAKASLRIKIEHSIGGLKRFRILDNRLRHHNFLFYDSILETCSALWNFYIKS
jgi:hypothetical protein